MLPNRRASLEEDCWWDEVFSQPLSSNFLRSQTVSPSQPHTRHVVDLPVRLTFRQASDVQGFKHRTTVIIKPFSNAQRLKLPQHFTPLRHQLFLLQLLIIKRSGETMNICTLSHSFHPLNIFLSPISYQRNSQSKYTCTSSGDTVSTRKNGTHS